MANSIRIESIHIKNFRSIRNQRLNVSDFNIFIGTNDVGKSNVLKALNLFFTGHTDYDTSFNFSQDFSLLFPPKSNAAKEISITITFIIPDTYKESGLYTWKKAWRAEGEFTDEILNKDGEKPTPRSRTASALKRIRFRYVPAIKSRDYYRVLLADLYEAVSSSLNSPLLESAKSFSTSVREHTEAITANVARRLDLISHLSVPDNLSDIFRALVFQTKIADGGISVALTYRGDGIQAQHLPIILKFIADEDQKSRNQGSMKINTIWGFEEPENGLEMARTFKMAKEFSEYSSDIQMFISTHSPAFYMQFSMEKVIVFYTYKKEKTEETAFTVDKSSKAINEQLGLMPLVAPYIAEQEAELKKARLLLSDNFLTDINTIAVEGKTDRYYIQKAIEVHSPYLQKKIDEGTLRILTKEEGCGTTQLCDWAIAWTCSGFGSKLYILFDKDAAGIKAKKDVDNNPTLKDRKKSFRSQHIQSSECMDSIFNKGIEFTFEIEHLFPIEVWEKFKQKKVISASVS